RSPTTRSSRSPRPSSRPPAPARSAMARSSSTTCCARCASAPASSTPTRSEAGGIAALAILGASGQVGSAVVASLADDPGTCAIRMIGRRPPVQGPDGAGWVAADLRDGADALAAALAGATAVFVLNPVPPDAVDVHADGAALARTIADAVVAAGRPRVVALSGQGAHLDQGNAIVRSLHALEAALVATGARTTFVRATSFMQNRVP